MNKIDAAYMQPRYHRCANGHMDLWYAGDPPCPLCEVRERGWAKAHPECKPKCEVCGFIVHEGGCK